MRSVVRRKYTNAVFIILFAVSLFFIVAGATAPVALFKSFAYYAVYPNAGSANKILQLAGSFSENIQSIVNVHQENLFYKKKSILTKLHFLHLSVS